MKKLTLGLASLLIVAGLVYAGLQAYTHRQVKQVVAMALPGLSFTVGDIDTPMGKHQVVIHNLQLVNSLAQPALTIGRVETEVSTSWPHRAKAEAPLVIQRLQVQDVIVHHREVDGVETLTTLRQDLQTAIQNLPHPPAPTARLDYVIVSNVQVQLDQPPQEQGGERVEGQDSAAADPTAPALPEPIRLQPLELRFDPATPQIAYAPTLQALQTLERRTNRAVLAARWREHMQGFGEQMEEGMRGIGETLRQLFR